MLISVFISMQLRGQNDHNTFGVYTAIYKKKIQEEAWNSTGQLASWKLRNMWAIQQNFIISYHLSGSIWSQFLDIPPPQKTPKIILILKNKGGIVIGRGTTQDYFAVVQKLVFFSKYTFLHQNQMGSRMQTITDECTPSNFYTWSLLLQM